MAKKVLIVDDEYLIVDMLTIRLKASGYDVISASNGKEGLEKLSKESPDLVILDVLMPVMDGFEFFKRVRHDHRYDDIPIITLTIRGSMRDTFETLATDAFISKPFDSEQLIEKVNSLCTKKALMLGIAPNAFRDVASAFEKMGYEVSRAINEDEMERAGKEAFYKVVIVHLNAVMSEPVKLLEKIKKFRNPVPRLAVYSDSSVRSGESNESASMLAIDEHRIKWRGAGVQAFFDPRICDKPFHETYNHWVSNRII